MIATIVLLAAYALLPEQYRFSRAIILLGAFTAFILIGIVRWFLIRTGILIKTDSKDENPATLIVGSEQEYDTTRKLMHEAGLQEKVLGRVAVHENDASGIGYWKKVQLLSGSVPFRELIFCEGVLSFKDIIETIPQLPKQTAVKFHALGSHSIVGSNSKDTSGEFVSKENGYKLNHPHNRRLKRLIDISIAFAGLITFPIHLILIKKPFSFFANCFAVLSGQKTWIGYTKEEKNLPHIRKGVVACNGIPLSIQQQLPAESLQMVDYWYARDYTPLSDLKLIKRVYKKLGS
jgi:hypothetical protein